MNAHHRPVCGPLRTRRRTASGAPRPAAVRRALALLSAAAWLTGAGTLPAQEVRLDATADTAVLRVGEQARVRLDWTAPPGFVLRALGPSDSLGAIEIVAVDSAAEGGAGGPARGAAVRTLTVTSFDTGTHLLPPYTAWYAVPSDTVVRQVSSGPVVFRYLGVDVDTAGEIREIKPPLGVPLAMSEVLPYLLAAAAASGLFWAVRRYIRSRRRGEAFLPGPPPPPEDQVALDALRSLASERLWQRGRVKEFHTAVSDILRMYLERRYAMPAMESTTGEILRSGPVAGLDLLVLAPLRETLTRSDLVKFAKFVPPPEQNERCIEAAREFVEATRRVRGLDAGSAAARPAAAGGPHGGDPSGGGAPPPERGTST